MATLEDKILGNKLQNYCSSSEDEESGDEDRSGDEEGNSVEPLQQTVEPAPMNSWNGSASNTGPKGVLEDWRRYKQLEAENRAELAKERIALAKKCTLSVIPENEEVKNKKNQEIEAELHELIDEDFLLEYQKKRMEELLKQLGKTPKFGEVINLTCQDEFLNTLDKEDVKVTVIIHLYDNKSAACTTMNGCLDVLAVEYPTYKFCKILANVAGLSKHFRVEGLPALLVYKGGQIIGNFVSLANEFGNDFFATDVERFLIEYGILPEK